MWASSSSWATLALALATALLQSVDARPSNLQHRRAETVELTVDPTPGKASNFGVDLFIETNINSGTDGGLYAELINNRAFQTPAGGPSGNNKLGQGTLASWSKVGQQTSLALTLDNPLSHALPKSVVVTSSAQDEACGLANSGFGGIAVKPQNYDVSFYARSVNGRALSTKVVVGLYDADQTKAYAEETLTLDLTSQWKQFKATLNPTAAAPSSDNVFSLKTAEGCGDGLQLNLISVFPPTWKGTVARQDLAQAMADTKPVLIRIPGGNDLEGNSIAAWFNWTNAIGPLMERPGRMGTWIGWNTEGFGLLEMFELVEKMGATAVLGIYAGYSLDRQAVPKDELRPYIDSALNQLHFLLDTTGQWAELRASLGRQQPYDLKHVEIGNEDWIYNAPDSWPYRYPAFYDAIHKEFPQLQLIASSRNSFTGQQAVDDHDYNTPDFFINAFDKYDSVERGGTLIYELEFAVLNSGLTNDKDLFNGPSRLKYPTLIGALAEGVYMLGAERNGDLVQGVAYAPLFMNEVPGLTQWTPDLISFDADQMTLSPSYYVQQAFGRNRIARIHTVQSSVAPKTAGVFSSVGSDGEGGKLMIKVINTKASVQSINLKLSGGDRKLSAEGAELWQLTGMDAQASNSNAHPDNVVPKTGGLPADSIQDGALQLSLPGYSFSVVTLPFA